MFRRTARCTKRSAGTCQSKRKAAWQAVNAGIHISRRLCYTHPSELSKFAYYDVQTYAKQQKRTNYDGDFAQVAVATDRSVQRREILWSI